MLQPSRYLLALPSLLPATVPTVRAHGDQDDHLRLTVLLASLFFDRVDPGLYRTCTSPSSPWKARRDALKQLLEEAQEGSHGTLVRLVDPDVLDMGELPPEARWQDAWFRRERSEFFAVLLDSFARCGWELVRPEPRPSTTGKLEERGCVVVDGAPPAGSETDDEQRLNAVADALLLPAIRPLIDALVENQHLSAGEVARMLEAASSSSGANDLTLEIAYDFLGIDAIETGKRLSVLRGSQPWNGVAGPFTLRDDGEDWTARPGSVPPEAARELARGGWLQVSAEQGDGERFAIANALRTFFQNRATTTNPGRTQEEHTWLAHRTPGGLEESMEVHYHAVESGDSALARSTAKHYGADLRRIAFALGTKKEATVVDFEAAADIYRTIVREFDAEDAYAWEYLGFNLAMTYRERPLPAPVEQEIIEAYANASRCEPSNPLYKGREIGFQARLGRNVLADFRRWLEHFRRVGGEAAVKIFAQRVLEGMSPTALLQLAGAPWAADLQRISELRKFFR